MQDYQSVYLDLHAEFRTRNESEKESIIDDVVFEIELIKQVEVNVDYILLPVEQHRAAMATATTRRSGPPSSGLSTPAPHYATKKDLIEAFVDSLSATADVELAWRAFITAKQEEEPQRIITDEGLDTDATRAFIDASFRNGASAAVRDRDH